MCVFTIAIIFIWYKKKTSLISSTVGNVIKLVPSLKEKTPTLSSLLPILSELTSSQNNENVITPVTVSHLSQTPPDELILPPELVSQLQMTRMDVPFQWDSSPNLNPTNIKTGPLSFEMFNRAANDLNDKGVINLKRYNKYVNKKQKPI